MAEDGLDFSSSSFNPLKALYTAGVQPPVPNVQIFNNINEYAQSLKLAKAVPTSQTTSNVKNSDERLAQRLKNIADNKMRSRNRDPSRLAHLMKVKSKADGIEEKVAMLEKAKKRPPRKTVLQRMEDNYKEGPLSVLYNCIEKKQQLRVWTRRLRGLRGICVGYLIAFDKHMNLAMMDVDEMFVIEEDVEIDPVITAQRIEKKRNKKRNWRRKKRQLLRKLNDEQNREDGMIQSSRITGEISGENHGNGGEEVQSTLCSDDHVFEFSLRITNVDGSRNITMADSSDMEGLQGSNSLCVMNLGSTENEVRVRDGERSMAENQRLASGDICKNKDAIKQENLTFEESHFSSKEGNVKDERELQGLYVRSEDHPDIKGETKEEMKGETKEERKEEMEEEPKEETKEEMKDNSHNLEPMSERLNDSTCCASSDEETGSDRESRNGRYSSDEEGKLKIWEEGQRGSEDEATTDDIQMKRFDYDLNENHSSACSSDEEDIWDGGQCSGEGGSDKEVKIGVMEESVKEEKPIMEGDEEGMLQILNSDETVPDTEKTGGGRLEEDKKIAKSDEEGRLRKWDSSHGDSGDEMETLDAEKNEEVNEDSLEDKKIARSDEKGSVGKFTGSHGDSEDEMETFDAEKNEEVNEDSLDEEQITRNDKEGTRSDEEGRLRKWDGSHGDSEEEMKTFDVEKRERIEDSLKKNQTITRSDKEGNGSDEEGNGSDEEGNRSDKEGNRSDKEGNGSDEDGNRSDEEGNRSDEEGRLRIWDGSRCDSKDERLTSKVERKEDVIQESLEQDHKITRSDEESELTAKGTVKPRRNKTKNEEKKEGEMTCKDLLKPKTNKTENEEKEVELTAKDIVKPKTNETRNEEKEGELTAKDIAKLKTNKTENEEKEEGELTSSDDEVRVSSGEEGEIIRGEKEVKNVDKVVMRTRQKRSAEKDSMQSTKKGTKNTVWKERSKSDSRKRENIGSDSKHERSKRFGKATDEVKHGRQQSRSRERSEKEDKRKRNVHERTDEKQGGDRAGRAKVDKVGSGNQERSTKETKGRNVERKRSPTRASDQTSREDYKAKRKENSELLYTSTETRMRKTSTREATRERSTSKLGSSSVRQDKPNIKKGSDLTKDGGGNESASKTKIEDKVKNRHDGICERKEQAVLQGDGRKKKSVGEKGRKVESVVKRLSTTDLASKRPKASKSATKDRRTTDSASSSSKRDKLNYKSQHKLRKSGTANETKGKLVEIVKTTKVVRKEKHLLQQNVSYGKKEDGERRKSTKIETLGKESGKRLGTATDNLSKTKKTSKYTSEEKGTTKYSSSLSSTTKEDKSAPSRRSSLKEGSKTTSDGKARTAVKTLSSKKGQEGNKIPSTEKKSSKEDTNYCGEVRKIESSQKKPSSSKKDRKGRKMDSLEKTPALKKDQNDCREGRRRMESLKKKLSLSGEKDNDCRKMRSGEMNPPSSKSGQIDCGKGGEIKSLQPKPSTEEMRDCGEAKKDTKTVKRNEKTSTNQQRRTTATSRRYTEKSRVKKSTDNKKDTSGKNTEGDKEKTENKNDELRKEENRKEENSKGNKGVKKIDKKRSLKRKQVQEDGNIKSLGDQRRGVDTTERPSKVRKVEENCEKQSRIKTKEAKLPGKVVSVRVLKVVRGKALVLKKRHVNQLFIRGDNVIMVAYENPVENKL